MKNKIYFLGPEGSYSHVITQKANLDYLENPCKSFGEIIKKTLTDSNSIGVIPIENSITSNVHENMDYLFKENLTVIAEAFLNIHLYLLGLKKLDIKEIKEIYSHPQAIAQCMDYITKYNFAYHDTNSTSSAKDIILEKNDLSCAVIGGKELAEDGNLTILDSDIAKDKFNMTRFLFVTAFENLKELNWNEDTKNKASIVFTVPHEPGSLAKILTELANYNFNLTKIESRPIPSTTWEYQFWIDIEVESTKKIDKNIFTDILKKYTGSHKIIGIYPAGKIYN